MLIWIDFEFNLNQSQQVNDTRVKSWRSLFVQFQFVWLSYNINISDFLITEERCISPLHCGIFNVKCVKKILLLKCRWMIQLAFLGFCFLYFWQCRNGQEIRTDIEKPQRHELKKLFWLSINCSSDSNQKMPNVLYFAASLSTFLDFWADKTSNSEVHFSLFPDILSTKHAPKLINSEN